MSGNENGRGPTWKIIATAAVIAIMGMLGWFTNHTYTQMDKKVDKEVYQSLCDDVGDIKKGMNTVRKDQVKMMIKLGVMPTENAEEIR
jgi:hypothetical protein